MLLVVLHLQSRSRGCLRLLLLLLLLLVPPPEVLPLAVRLRLALRTIPNCCLLVLLLLLLLLPLLCCRGY